jgi:transposase-like protein
LSETRRYRKFTAQQKLELVLASLRREKRIAELCREHAISETLLRRWRDQVLEAGGERLAGTQERSVAAEQRRKIAELERALGKKTYELEILGSGFRAWRLSERVAYARELTAEGHRPAVVARILKISRQAIYRVPKPRRAPASPSRPPADEVEAAIVSEAEAHPTDGYRMVTAWARRRLGRAVSRKRCSG